MSHDILACANGVTIYWDTEACQIHLTASQRGWRYITKRAKKKGLTPEEFSRQILTETLRRANITPLDDGFAVLRDGS
jgi:hypothetical protein